MTDITKSLLSATALLLKWNSLGECSYEDHLRVAFMSAFIHTRKSHPPFILLRETEPPTGFDKRLDLNLVPTWPPQQSPVAAGEFKFFPIGRARDYLTRIGSRLSDIHYVHSLAAEAGIHGFFVDIVLDRRIVGRDAYDAIRRMCDTAASALYHPIENILPEHLKDLRGIKSFATASIDHTPRTLLRRMRYGFLFPPMDLGGTGKAKRGPAFVKGINEDGLISIGVKKAGIEQRVSYRAFVTKDNVEGAVCFAVFGPGGILMANTDHLIDVYSGR
jgi:hypothetical protein